MGPIKFRSSLVLLLLAPTPTTLAIRLQLSFGYDSNLLSFGYLRLKSIRSYSVSFNSTEGSMGLSLSLICKLIWVNLCYRLINCSNSFSVGSALCVFFCLHISIISVGIRSSQLSSIVSLLSFFTTPTEYIDRHVGGRVVSFFLRSVDIWHN